MYLIALCQKCQEEIHIKPNESSRYDLARTKNANEFKERCIQCNHVNKLHVNDVYATSSSTILLIIAIVILAIAVLIWLLLRTAGVLYISTLPAVIIGIIYNNQNNAVRTFNKHRLKRKNQ